MAKRREAPDLFSVADELNSKYQGKRVRITDGNGREAVGMFVRSDRVVWVTNGREVERILIDYDELRLHSRLVKTRAGQNPVFPYAVFYVEDKPEIEVLASEVSADG